MILQIEGSVPECMPFDIEIDVFQHRCPVDTEIVAPVEVGQLRPWLSVTGHVSRDPLNIRRWGFVLELQGDEIVAPKVGCRRKCAAIKFQRTENKPCLFGQCFSIPIAG